MTQIGCDREVMRGAWGYYPSDALSSACVTKGYCNASDAPY